MAEHVLAARSLPAEWTAEHEALAAAAAELGLPQPTAASWQELVVGVEDVDGGAWGVEASRAAAVSNCSPRRPRLDHTAAACPGPGRCPAHHPRPPLVSGSGT